MKRKLIQVFIMTIVSVLFVLLALTWCVTFDVHIIDLFLLLIPFCILIKLIGGVMKQ
jgi:hypothetical protein